MVAVDMNPLLVEPPPLLPPPEDGGGLLVGVEVDPVKVESERLRPTVEAPLVSVPESAMTATITTIPMMVPSSAAASTLIIARGLYQDDSDDLAVHAYTPRRGYARARRTTTR